MLLIPCPWCGPRAEVEFRHAGEAHLKRDPGASHEEWGGYLYSRGNPRGRHVERWRHIHGCGQFFNAVRDTHSDAIERSYPAEEGGHRPSPGVEIAVQSGDAA